MVLRPGHDWFYPYYRDRALCLALGVTPVRDAAAGRRRGRRSRLRRPPDALPLGPPRLQHRQRLPRPPARSSSRPSGCAEASRYLDGAATDEITLVTSGDGATSEGEFWEALNVACLRAPAAAVPDRRQRLRHLRPHRVPDRRRQHLARWSPAFPACSAQEVDGTDFLASYRAMQEAAGVVPRGPAARRWCTPTSSGPTRTRSPTTSGSTRPRAERAGRSRARPGHPLSRSGWWTKACSTASVLQLHHPRDRRGGARGHPPGAARRSARRRIPPCAHLYSETIDPTAGRVRRRARTSAASP